MSVWQEVETGAGTATVARVLAERINEGAVENEKVKPRNLEAKVREVEGKVKIRNPNFKDSDQPPPAEETGSREMEHGLPCGGSGFFIIQGRAAGIGKIANNTGCHSIVMYMLKKFVADIF